MMAEHTPSAETTAKPTSLQGLAASRDDERALLEALEQAFDYRGDVTLELTDGSSTTGYIFDRRTRGTLGDSSLRLLTAKSDNPVCIAYDRIERVHFSGKDTAHGKSFENWVQRFIEKKVAEHGGRAPHGLEAGLQAADRRRVQE